MRVALAGDDAALENVIGRPKRHSGWRGTPRVIAAPCGCGTGVRTPLSQASLVQATRRSSVFHLLQGFVEIAWPLCVRRQCDMKAGASNLEPL